MSNNNKKERVENMREDRPKQTLYVSSYGGVEFSKVFDSYQAAWNFREIWKLEVGANLPMSPHNGFVYSCDIIPGKYVEDAWLDGSLKDSLNVG